MGRNNNILHVPSGTSLYLKEIKSAVHLHVAIGRAGGAGVSAENGLPIPGLCGSLVLWQGGPERAATPCRAGMTCCDAMQGRHVVLYAGPA